MTPLVCYYAEKCCLKFGTGICKYVQDLKGYKARIVTIWVKEIVIFGKPRVKAWIGFCKNLT